MGDSIFLIVNAPFMVKNTLMSCSNLALEVSFELQLRIHELLCGPEYVDTDMYLRVGVARGDLAAGVFEATNFRVFGSAVNLSQRLEAECRWNEINMQGTVADELVDKDSHNISTHSTHIKGFGEMSYVIIRNKTIVL